MRNFLYSLLFFRFPVIIYLHISSKVPQRNVGHIWKLSICFKQPFWWSIMQALSGRFWIAVVCWQIENNPKNCYVFLVRSAWLVFLRKHDWFQWKQIIIMSHHTWQSYRIVVKQVFHEKHQQKLFFLFNFTLGLLHTKLISH